MQIGFYFDQTRCTACYACCVACKDWHDVPAGPAKWLRIDTLEEGRYPKVRVTNMFSACYHCADPDCVQACPVSAITKREGDGVVVVDREACRGKDLCDLCLQACPYHSPQFGAEENAKMQKCNLCPDRLAEGKQPICVAACPMYALDAGSLEELKTKYGDVRQAKGFTDSPKNAPSIVFKPKKA